MKEHVNSHKPPQLNDNKNKKKLKEIRNDIILPVNHPGKCKLASNKTQIMHLLKLYFFICSRLYIVNMQNMITISYSDMSANHKKDCRLHFRSCIQYKPWLEGIITVTCPLSVGRPIRSDTSPIALRSAKTLGHKHDYNWSALTEIRNLSRSMNALKSGFKIKTNRHENVTDEINEVWSKVASIKQVKQKTIRTAFM